MRTVIIGAGLTGLFIAIALARHGREVVVVDRDPGPHGNCVTEMWHRKGVMQFHHAHSFRGQVVDALNAEMPDVLSDIIRAGATVVTDPGAPGRPVALLCRRMVFEHVLRGRASTVPGITLVTGHVDRIIRERGLAVGVEVQGRTLAAGLVIDASGRSSRVTGGVRGIGEGGECGAAYVTRQYRLRDNASGGPTNGFIGLSLTCPGYLANAFLHDNRTFSVNITHDGSDPRMRRLRYDSVFEAAVGRIPMLADWVNPARSVPISPVLPGGRLYNSYRGQLGHDGRLALPGMISVGDAVCTTTPLAGRGVTLAFLQSRELIRLLDEHGGDTAAAALEFDAWCLRNIKPWYDDHRYTDSDRVRRWSGGDVDLSRPLPADLIVASAVTDSKLSAVVAPYTSMDALPASLAAAEGAAHAIYSRGWRPPAHDGPGIDELAQLCAMQQFGAA